MNIKTLIAPLLCAAALGFTSCSSTTPGEDNRNYYIDFANLEASNTNGATLTVQKGEDTPIVTLTTSQTFPSDQFIEGMRLVINYWPHSNKQYESGPITVLQAAYTQGNGQEPEVETAGGTNNWKTETVRMDAMFRTGDYLNMVIASPGIFTPKKCKLYVDANTANSSCIDLYLIFEGGATSGVDARTYYCSWNIGKLFDKTNASSVRVIYIDPSNNKQFKTFNRLTTNN